MDALLEMSSQGPSLVHVYLRDLPPVTSKTHWNEDISFVFSRMSGYTFTNFQANSYFGAFIHCFDMQRERHYE